MLSKLEAADLAATLGIKTVIAHGRTKDVIKKIVLDNSNIGTHFLPRPKVGGKKRWIALSFSRRPKGSITVDNGAEKALLEKGSSLLSRGILSVEGVFEKGDTVNILSEKRSVLGRGLVNYSSDDLKKNIRQRLPSEVIHRDHLVVAKCLEWAVY